MNWVSDILGYNIIVCCFTNWRSGDACHICHSEVCGCVVAGEVKYVDEGCESRVVILCC